MFVLIELWHLKPAWRALTPEQRREKLHRVGFADLERRGVELAGLAKLGPQAPGRPHDHWDYAVAWRAPSAELVDEIRDRKRRHRWIGEYFEREVILGTDAGSTLDDFRDDLAGERSGRPHPPRPPGLIPRFRKSERLVSDLALRLGAVELVLHEVARKVGVRMPPGFGDAGERRGGDEGDESYDDRDERGRSAAAPDQEEEGSPDDAGRRDQEGAAQGEGEEGRSESRAGREDRPDKGEERPDKGWTCGNFS